MFSPPKEKQKQKDFHDILASRNLKERGLDIHLNGIV